MLRHIVHYPFHQFNRQVLDEAENATLDQGMEKHRSILKTALAFLFPQIALAAVAPDLFLVMSAVSFLLLLLGTAWYVVSFQNVSEEQLKVGVANFITKKMFRAFLLCLDTLVTCVVIFLIRTLLPEYVILMPAVDQFPLWPRVLILIANVSWVVLVFWDLYFASVAYDAADSLLGDGFPTLMRGAKANSQNLPLLRALQTLIDLQQAICEKQGIQLLEEKRSEQEHVTHDGK